jgi:formylmethanofuran dehydrogenase subunit E
VSRYVCLDCRDDYYYCEKCGEYFTKDQVHELEDGRYHCDDCYVEEDEEEDC